MYVMPVTCNVSDEGIIAGNIRQPETNKKSSYSEFGAFKKENSRQKAHRTEKTN